MYRILTEFKVFMYWKVTLVVRVLLLVPVTLRRFSRSPYLANHLPIFQNTFMLGSNVPCRVGFYSKASDPRVYAKGGARDHNLVHFQNVFTF